MKVPSVTVTLSSAPEREGREGDRDSRGREGGREGGRDGET